MYDVTAIGELLVDFTVDRLQKDGYPVLAAHPGGAVANFLTPLAKYGCKTALIAQVGNDAFGRLLLRTVAEQGIDTNAVGITEEAFTSLSFVTRDDMGERTFSFARKPGADLLLTVDQQKKELIDQSRVVHFGTVGMTGEPSRTTHQQLVTYAKQKGKLISFDPNLREPLWSDLDAAKEQMLWGLAQADVIKISDNELDFLFGCGPKEGAAQLFAQFHPKLVFVTLGKDGCYFRNPIAEGMVPGLTDIKVLDTTGAGDIFGGTAMYGLLSSQQAPETLEEDALRRIARFACVAASLSTTELGGISSVKDLKEIQTYLNHR
jgi:fructokinase